GPAMTRLRAVDDGNGVPWPCVDIEIAAQIPSALAAMITTSPAQRTAVGKGNSSIQRFSRRTMITGITARNNPQNAISCPLVRATCTVVVAEGDTLMVNGPNSTHSVGRRPSQISNPAAALPA